MGAVGISARAIVARDETVLGLLVLLDRAEEEATKLRAALAARDEELTALRTTPTSRVEIFRHSFYAKRDWAKQFLKRSIRRFSNPPQRLK
jgi:hypothetical protein